MKLYVIPVPYDEHGMAELVVMAHSPEAARGHAENWPVGAQLGGFSFTRRRQAVELDKLTEHEGRVYFNDGCDC